MGCDIHTIIERKVGDKWVAEVIGRTGYNTIEDRHYAVFGALAGVRRDGNEPPHGFPGDASDTARLQFDDWGPDAHTPSFLPIDRAYELYVEGVNSYAGATPDHFWKVFGIDRDDVERRLVFWFDN